MDSLLTASKPMTLNINVNQKNEDDFLNNLMGSNNNNKKIMILVAFLLQGIIYSIKNIIIVIFERKNLSEINTKKFELKEKIDLVDYTQYRKSGQKPKEKFFQGV